MPTSNRWQQGARLVIALACVGLTACVSRAPGVGGGGGSALSPRQLSSAWLESLPPTGAGPSRPDAGSRTAPSLPPDAATADHATVLASLADSYLPPIDQNSAMFFGRQVVDDHYGGMAFGDEGARCAEMLRDPKITTMIMGNHGVLIIGQTVAETFNRLTYFERAAETYIRALQTGQPLRVLSERPQYSYHDVRRIGPDLRLTLRPVET